MISVSNVTMRYGSKLLFEDVSVTFTTGRRYGLTGPNGAGKSTFMKVLTGEIDAQKGTVVRPKKIGVLKQDQYEFDAYRVIDTVIMGNKGLWAALEERERIYEKPELTDEDGSRLGELEGIVGDEDGYEAEANAAVLLQGLDIPDEVHERKMSELQGGQKVRVLLAQALFGNPQALLLDEPTNYLDLDSIHWLENFLNRYNGTVITISHDRHFLNSVCTHIADIDYETIITYTGGYDDMVLQKTQVRARIESQNEQREKKIAQLNDFIARFSAGTRSSQVNSRKKEVERLATTELARSNIQRPYIRFDMLRPSGKHVLEIEGINKSYTQPDGKTEHVIHNFNAAVMRGDKVVLIGRNGQGKTTMLKALLANAGLDESDPTALDSGTVKWGHEAQIGYFAQDHKGSIQLGMTAADWLHQFDPQASREDIRGILGQMLFRGEEGNKKTDALSGGEAARLLFCKLMLQKPNILILDEPTNHLDLESINALNQALQKYEGTVFLVTHDEDLIDEVGTRIWHFEGGPTDFHITDHKGPYAEYQEQLALAAK
ncbi:ABC-F family ATP-binding cassette domain-containing protein [Edaphobacter sp. 12200R-103]|uniref:ABC-F family ATP-binding cassette domain-containing protein n=1 Tax=Edaphobacter sp. 12200R-103 TaxID=2703788 RepID=UPI00138B7C17|nr:ATP-binding cassette domain-containing protein [Edaphobacter sp. 12200R-103]QHS51990.1 ATP-binding cassette domain-containing protein [Edaphobacter sp. 12200R-103]